MGVGEDTVQRGTSYLLQEANKRSDEENIRKYGGECNWVVWMILKFRIIPVQYAPHFILYYTFHSSLLK